MSFARQFVGDLRMANGLELRQDGAIGAGGRHYETGLHSSAPKPPVPLCC